MSIKAFPLNQQEYSYNAQDVMKYYAGRNSGVFETGENLKVSANGGLEIRVNSGMGWLSRDYVASVAFWNESVEYLMVDAGHDTYDRIDLVVVSWNFVQQEQNPKLIIRKGTPASSPAVPSLVNDSSTIEIALARINVGKGDIELSDSDIVDLRGNDTYCPMVYDEQTIREAFRKCVGFADGVNKISDFPNVTPASSDKILIEQGGEGKSATLENLPISKKVQSGLDTKINKTDALTYEEIMATNPVPDLTNKVASASALKHLKPITIHKSHSSNPSTSYVEQTGCRITIPANSIYGIYVVRYYWLSNPNKILISTVPSDNSDYDKHPLAYAVNDGSLFQVMASVTSFTSDAKNIYVYTKDNDNKTNGTNPTYLYAWYITL